MNSSLCRKNCCDLLGKGDKGEETKQGEEEEEEKEEKEKEKESAT